jgi:predicted nucleic-acid-binding Zn-ribbon protein
MNEMEQQLGSRFVCAKCKGHGALVSRFAATGTGISRFFDIQHNRFVAASCKNCGYTEIYNLKVLGERGGVGNVLDVLFGG